MQELTGKTAVITGGASGIGLATARLLRAAGMDICHRRHRSRPRCRRCGQELDGLAVVCDVGDRSSVEALAEAAFDRYGTVHVVFNNAGVAVAGPTVDMGHDDWEWLMRVNLWGPIHGVEAFLPRMVAQGEAAATCCSPPPLLVWYPMLGLASTA